MSGSPRQRRTGIGYRGVGDLPPPALESALTVEEVDAVFEELRGVSGDGAQARRRELLGGLMAAATDVEQEFLVRVLLGELRQGALEAALVGAIAAASGVKLGAVRRAVMLRGDLATVATLALLDGETAVAAVGLSVGRAVQPMLASSAKSVAEALAATGEAAVEEKLDGVRAQIHIAHGVVAVFTRTLDDVTERVPEVVALVREMPCATAVLDAELIALGPDGRPRPFQQTASRFATRDASGPPLTTVAFDLLHLDGTDLLDSPGVQRWAALEPLLPAGNRVKRVITSDPAMAQAALDQALATGHEGVVVKGVEAPYEAGRRGAAWVKVKPVHTLDLVIVAAEWGSGRRKGWLSNLHLAARADDGSEQASEGGSAMASEGGSDLASKSGGSDLASRSDSDLASKSGGGGFVMLGKTFKGLTDAMLTWQTAELLRLADGPTDGWVVRVRPELVVEIALDGLQQSSRYPGGVALRFARVVRHRPDKPVADAATLSDVLALAETV